MPTSRQLAAIMFTDIVGYTTLMGEDEQKAFVLLRKNRALQKPIIEQYNGRWIKELGDGVLASFSTASDAVNAAIKIQEACTAANDFQLRIGIHLGEVVFEESDVFGDGVNIASRLQSLATIGSIWISDSVQKNISNKKDIQTKFIKTETLKHVQEPVRIYEVITNQPAEQLPSNKEFQKKVSEKSIAVLPFVNMSADPENEYFSDGISEEILNALTRVQGLQVIARTSSFSFKGKNEDIRQIGTKLGVSTILEGSVRKSGKKVRITAQLINTADGYHIWSEVYDSDLEDIFQVQDEISLKILNRLKENFAETKTSEPIVKAPTENLDAYNLYLKGRYHWNKSNPEEITKAIKDFEEAIRIDSQFAHAYCALSYCYSFMGSAGLMPPAVAYSKANEYTLKAIALDPDDAESHLSLATIKFFHHWDFEGAEKSLNIALSLCLNSSLINQVHGWFLIAKGDFDKAIEKMKQALVLDPLSLPLIGNLADAYGFAGRYQEALEQYDKAIEIDPRFRRAFEGKGMLYLIMGEYDKAIESTEHYHKLIGHPLKGLSSLGHAYAAAGQREKALECLEKIKQRKESEPDKVFDMDFAFLYAGLKDHDKAFHYLNKAYENRMGIACLGMIFCIRFPLLKELKTDERFQGLKKKMKLDS
ncbi:MAG: tetratricopeptide repeat protein [Chitinophagaceae bacterium]